MSNLVSISFKIVIIVAFSTLLFEPLKAENTKTEIIEVGAILPLTGDLAFIGTEIQKGMKIALSEFSSVNVVFEDDHSFAKIKVVRAAKKLIDLDSVDVILNAAVNTVHALEPILSKKEVPGIVIWDHNRSMKKLGDYVFSIGYSTELAGEDIADFAYSKSKLGKISVISAHDEWSETISTAFQKRYTARGGIIDMHETVNDGETDFRSIVLKIKSKGSQGIYAPLNPPSVNSFIKQARQIGFEGKIFVADGFGDNELKELGAYANGVLLSQLWVEDKQFLDKYSKQYGSQVSPTNLGFAGLGYDAIKLIADVTAELRANNIYVNSGSIKELLGSFEASGVTGKSRVSPFAAELKREPIVQVQEGRFVKLAFP